MAWHTWSDGTLTRCVYRVYRKLHDVSRPTGMCLTDGQILTGQGRDAVPFSRIREEEFDGNSQGTSGESKEDGTELYRLPGFL